ncbi:unnamed protein product [Phaedon cochleariae]|uniref:PBZ-type domain-containing protein n=1 Tax=Phaedon cochleariae TaxID=80249 RepID=A0A9P0DJM0_PHACE|nr:unnamed protein product [Phaedon cochleariae]
MDSLYEKYQKDIRMPCKYGAKCYQKNPVHCGKYKHPPTKNKASQGDRQPRKKIKLQVKAPTTQNDSDSDSNAEPSNSNLPEKVVNNDVSESDEDSMNNYVSESDEEAMNKDVSDEDTNKMNMLKSDEETENKYTSELNEENKKNDVSESDEETDEASMKTALLNDKNEATFIKKHFLTDMPQDFYQFWDFCRNIKPENPREALKPIGLFLVGPFDVLAGKFWDAEPDSDFLIHWRYFRDPPELQTVLKGDASTGYHIGYFRDSPDENPVFLVNNQANKDGILHQMGSNIFAAVNFYLEDLKKSGDPFKKMYIGKIQSALKSEADKLKIDLSKKTPSMVAREKKIVTRTFNKIGLVVPYDKKTEQGYRALALNNKDLNTLFTKLQNSKTEEEKEKYLSELQPVLTYASIATDECDFGTGIELGWNIISHGVECLNFSASRFLKLNYELLKREAFGQIAVAHMKNRRKGSNLSIL